MSRIGARQPWLGKLPSPAKVRLAADVEALHAVQASRPLRPPPTRFDARAVSSAALALRADKRAGLL